MREIEVDLTRIVPNKKAFNPSIIRAHGGLQMFYRYERLGSFNTELAVVELDEKLKPRLGSNKRLKMRKFSPSTTTFDDPRAFIYKSDLYFMYAQGMQARTPTGGMWVSGVAMAQVLKGMNVGRQHLPIYGNNENMVTGRNENKASEKNWSPFECQDGLYMVYTINPLVIVKWDFQAGQCVKVSESNFDQSFWKWGSFLGGGTPLIRRGNEYVGFFHSFFDDGSGKATCRRYNMGFYSIRRINGQWKVWRISSKPLLIAERNDARDLRKPAGWWLPNCIYPCGFTEHQGKVLVSAGWQDCRCMLYEFTWDEIFKDVIKVAEGEDPADEIPAVVPRSINWSCSECGAAFKQGDGAISTHNCL